MATESKDVELRVRAKDYSRKTLEGVVTTLGDLTKAQEAQVAGAKKGEVSAKALADSYDKIENAVKALIGQHALTKVFETQSQALQSAKDKADAARTSYTAYADSLAGVEEKTKKQVAEQERLARVVAGADKAQLNAQTRLDGTIAKLDAYGIAAGDVANAQKRMADGVAVGNAALDRQAAALDSVEADIASKVAADRLAADVASKAAADQVAALKQVTDAATAAAAAQTKNAQAAQAAHAKQNERLLAERATVAALKASAQQAEASAKSYSTLGRSVASIKGSDLADQLKQIVNPAAVARTNVKGLEAEVAKLGSKVAAINGPVKDFKNTLQSLEATQRGVGAIGAQIDAYTQQMAVLRGLQAQYRAARTEVRSLTEQMRAGGGDAAELTSKLNAAESKLKSAATAMGGGATKARELRDGLRAAGVDTRNLTDAEQRLIATANAATGSVNTLTSAYSKHGAAVEVATKKFSLWGKGARTTLSYSQRLRGELLGLAAGFVGVQAAIAAATGALDASKTKSKIEGQLGAAFGTDPATIKAEWDYVMTTADRLGVAFREVAPAYAKFAIAAKSFGFTGQETRFVFESTAKAARVAGLSADEFQGALKALEQMMSKGKITAEELNGQLADRLPGALTILAKEMGVPTEKLLKMMEQSELTSNAVINLARGMNNTFKSTAATQDSLTAAQDRFSNAFLRFQIAVAGSGLEDAFKRLLANMVAFFDSADGKQFAQNLGGAFTLVINGLNLLVTNIEYVKIAFSVLFGLGVAKWATTAVAGITVLFRNLANLWTILNSVRGVVVTAGAAMGTLGGSAAGTAVGLGVMRLGIRALLGPLGLVVLAIEAAIWAYDKLNSKAKVKNTGGATGSWADDPTKPGSADTPEDPNSGLNASARASKAFEVDAAKRDKKLEEERLAAKVRSAKDQAKVRADIIKGEYDDLRKVAEREITNKHDLGIALKKLDEQQAKEIATDRIKYDAEHAKSGAAAADREIGLKEKVADALKRIEAEIARDETKLDANATFEERKKTRLDAIAHSYSKVGDAIRKLEALSNSSSDKQLIEDAKKRLDEYVKQRQAVEETKVTLEEVKKLEKELADQEALRTAKIEERTALYNAQGGSQIDFLNDVRAINKEADVAAANAARNLQAFVDASLKVNPDLLNPTEQAQIKSTTTRGQLSTTEKDADDKLTAAKIANLDAVIAKRDAAEASLKAQLDLKMISEDEYAARSNANADTHKAKILELNAIILADLEARRSSAEFQRTATAEQLAALDAEIAKRQLLATTTGNTAKALNTVEQAAKQALGSGLDTALNGLVTSMTALAQGTMNAGQAFQSMAQTAIGALAQLLQQIALAIIKQMILNALTGMGGPVGTSAGQLGGTAAENHRGGIVGSANGTRARVNPAWFAGAPRFHDGGFPGLKSDEVPSILQTGEEVLARDDPRNALNGASGGGSGGAGTRFVLVDDRAKVPEAMQSAEGERVIMQVLRRNATTVKQLAR